MRNAICAVCATVIVAGLGSASPADADITIDLGVPAAPEHSGEYIPMSMFNETYVNDTWYLTGAEAFPALAGQSGNLTLRIRVPNSERLMVDKAANFATSLKWWPGGSTNSSSLMTLTPTVSFVDPVGTPPAALSTNEAKFYSPQGQAPPVLGAVFIHQFERDVPGDWGFGGLDITIPLASLVDTFPTTEPLAGPDVRPRLSFEFILPGNHEDTPAAEQFTWITPEPATLSLLTLGSLAVIRSRRRR